MQKKVIALIIICFIALLYRTVGFGSMSPTYK